MQRTLESFWDDLWEREEEFFSAAKPEFRHDTAFIPVSTISGQFYCEYKFENEVILGKIPTEAKAKGTELHDELIPQVEVTKKQFTNLVGKKGPSFAVLGVWGNVAGLRIVGMPDHIIWSEGRPLWLVELKTTGGDPCFLWPDQENQTRIYALLLDKMGFDCSRLQLALVRLKSQALSEEQRKIWVTKISSHLVSRDVKELQLKYQDQMRVHLLKHDKALAEAAIMEKRGYWLGEREPTSSTSIGKCKACEYNSVCPKSLFKPADPIN